MPMYPLAWPRVGPYCRLLWPNSLSLGVGAYFYPPEYNPNQVCFAQRLLEALTSADLRPLPLTLERSSLPKLTSLVWTFLGTFSAHNPYTYRVSWYRNVFRILKIGPSFEVNGKAIASLDLDVDMTVGFNYTIGSAKFTFPPTGNSPAVSASIGDTCMSYLSYSFSYLTF